MSKKKSSPPLWQTLDSSDKILSKKFYPRDENELANECLKYNEKIWINNRYGLKDVLEVASPIFLFKQYENNNYETLRDGIHNFILLWDSVKKAYILLTAFFNPFEFGNKHNMLSLRTTGRTPDVFIISGEIYKNNNGVKFHDTSSLYFESNKKNFKTHAPVIYIRHLIREMNMDINNISAEQFKQLKAKILEDNSDYMSGGKNCIKSARTIQEMLAEIEEYSYPKSGGIQRKYIDLVESLVTDAFNTIFTENIGVKYVPSFTPEEYGRHDQKNVPKFLVEMCNANINIPFDVYFDSNCKGPKSRFNSCQISEISEDYIRETLGQKK